MPQACIFPATVYPTYLAPSDAAVFAMECLLHGESGPGAEQADESSGFVDHVSEGRYRTITDLNNAYGTCYADFTQVAFPSQLPRRSSRFGTGTSSREFCWSIPAAHQFTVFLPMMPPTPRVSLHSGQARAGEASDRPGEAGPHVLRRSVLLGIFPAGRCAPGSRLVLDYGSRAPQLMLPALIGDTYMGSSYLRREPPPRPVLKAREMLAMSIVLRDGTTGEAP